MRVCEANNCPNEAGITGGIAVERVFVAPLLMRMLAALGLHVLLRRVLTSAGFYRLAWHRALFDASL